MPTVRGREEVRRYLQRLPEKIEKKLLRGAAKAGAAVIADEARLRANSEEVREGIVTRARTKDGRIVVRITVRKGWAYTLGVWAEYGTDPHFISVDDSQRNGMTVRRINQLQKEEGSLVINGQFVGTTVFHPGARAFPFLRPALDVKERDAIAAAQSYINTRLAREGLGGADEPEGGDE